MRVPDKVHTLNPKTLTKTIEPLVPDPLSPSPPPTLIHSPPNPTPLITQGYVLNPHPRLQFGQVEAMCSMGVLLETRAQQLFRQNDYSQCEGEIAALLSRADGHYAKALGLRPDHVDTLCNR